VGHKFGEGIEVKYRLPTFKLIVAGCGIETLYLGSILMPLAIRLLKDQLAIDGKILFLGVRLKALVKDCVKKPLAIAE
jgi:hypothetical protein